MQDRGFAEELAVITEAVLADVDDDLLAIERLEGVEQIRRVERGVDRAVAAAEEAKQGKFALGGCCISDDSPRWHCRDCEHEWGRIDDE